MTSTNLGATSFRVKEWKPFHSNFIYRSQLPDMKGVMLRFPHLAEQILQKLDNEGLTKSREVEPLWQEFIDERDYPWLRIVNIPTILVRGNLFHHLAAEYAQIDAFEMLLNEDSNTDPKMIAVKLHSSLPAEKDM